MPSATTVVGRGARMFHAPVPTSAAPNTVRTQSTGRHIHPITTEVAPKSTLQIPVRRRALRAAL